MDTQTALGIEDVKRVAFVVKELRTISRRLHRLDEQACNVGQTTAAIRRTTKLLYEAEQLAQRLGLHAYHQGDPRGVSLYLIDETMNDTNYNNGLCIY